MAVGLGPKKRCTAVSIGTEGNRGRATHGEQGKGSQLLSGVVAGTAGLDRRLALGSVSFHPSLFFSLRETTVSEIRSKTSDPEEIGDPLMVMCASLCC